MSAAELVKWQNPVTPSAFASAERLPAETMSEQVKQLASNSLLLHSLDAIDAFVLVINQARQVVFANKAFLDLVHQEQDSQLVGLRFGEIIKCHHALGEGALSGGCGTTKFCRHCGSIKAILQSQANGEGIYEARFVLKQSSESLILRIHASEIVVEGEPFTLLSAQDISAQKHKEALESVFFHDILNTAAGVQGMADLFEFAPVEKQADFRLNIKAGINTIIEEINSHRLLSSLEKGTYDQQRVELNSLALLKNLQNLYAFHKSSTGKLISLDDAACSFDFQMDRALVLRTLGNMLKNALEASVKGGIVTLSCRCEAERVIFTVHNETHMSDDVKAQVFQRSFSTKGKGRGLGTYSMRMIAENYLAGEVGFTSHHETGTTFTLCCGL